MSVNSDSKAYSTRNQSNKRLAVFLDFLCAHLVVKADGIIDTLASAESNHDEKDVFGSVTKVVEQVQMVMENISSFAEEIFKENGYLARVARFPHLIQTLVAFMLKAHVHSGSIDRNIDSLRKFFIILTLLSPHISHCDEYTSLLNSIRNTKAECLVDQPYEKRAAIKKEVFIKGKHDTLDDVLTFIANVMVFVRFWVRMDANDPKSYPFVIQPFVDVADILSSVEYREFDWKFLGGHEYMAHTLIIYFNISSLFVRVAKVPAVIRHTKVTNEVGMTHLRMSVMIHKK